MRLFSFRNGLLLTGNPGVGKTTLLKHLYESLKKLFPEKKFFGFLTEEKREGKLRLGFDLVPIGETQLTCPTILPLARKIEGLRGKKLVGNYADYEKNLETLIKATRKCLGPDKILILDEIGKMEVRATAFLRFLEEVLNSKIPFIATLGKGDNPFLKGMRERTGILLCEVTKENRDFLRKRLILEFHRKGKLVVLEGIDGAGKTTLYHHLKVKLNTNDFIFSREPTNSSYGQKLRRILSSQEEIPQTEILELFIKDRLEHVKNLILPSLIAGKTVILDRYYPSTVAYQGACGFDLKELLVRNETFAPTPDYLVYLDLPVSVALERLKKRSLRLTVFERQDKLQKIAQNYERLLPLFNSIKLKATNPVEGLEEEVISLVKEVKMSWKSGKKTLRSV